MLHYDDEGDGSVRSRRPVWLLRVPRGLDAGAFAFVMATAIVSIAASQQGVGVLSVALLALACLAWVALAVVVGRRALAHRQARPRLQSFALVAATAVIGARITPGAADTVALVLWSASCAFWLLLLLQRPRVERFRGGSLMLIVAIESLAVLAARLGPRRIGTPLVDFALAGWLLGLVLYPIVTGGLATALRRSRGFYPDLWILMGALAITTLAGSQLLLVARALHKLTGLKAGLADADLATWAAAAALIIPLALVDVRARSRWRYEAARWSFVFPLGMFSVATHTLARAAGVPPLNVIARSFFIIALAAWTLIFLTAGRYASTR